MCVYLQIFSGNDAKKPRDYEGPREAKGIVSHLNKQAGPATLPLSDAAAVKAFRKLDEDRDSAGRKHALCMTAYDRLCVDLVPVAVLLAQLPMHVQIILLIILLWNHCVGTSTLAIKRGVCEYIAVFCCPPKGGNAGGWRSDWCIPVWHQRSIL